MPFETNDKICLSGSQDCCINVWAMLSGIFFFWLLHVCTYARIYIGVLIFSGFLLRIIFIMYMYICIIHVHV